MAINNIDTILGNVVIPRFHYNDGTLGETRSAMLFTYTDNGYFLGSIQFPKEKIMGFEKVGNCLFLDLSTGSCKLKGEFS